MRKSGAKVTGSFAPAACIRAVVVALAASVAVVAAALAWRA